MSISSKEKARAKRRSPKNPSPPQTCDEEFNASDYALESRSDWNALTPLEKWRRRKANPLRQIRDELKFEEKRGLHLELIVDLMARARAGNLDSLKELVLIAHESTRRLSELAHEAPEFVRLVAQYYPDWPQLCVLPKSPSSANYEALKALGLDARRPMVAEGRKCRRLATKPPTLWALRLLNTLNSCRSLARKSRSNEPQFRWYIDRPNPDRDFAQALILPIHDPEYTEIRNAASELPPFSSETARTWWKVAEKLLLKISDGRPWELQGLAGPTRVNRVAQESTQEGVKRSVVIKAVRQAFEHLG